MDQTIAKKPKVTVLMPVYNCEKYVGEAIDSIINQTFTDFEFLIIDDASTDKTVSIVEGYTDSRIKLILKSENEGLTKNLNFGLSIAKGEYIARMDGDDISLPERFVKQVTFLNNNPNVIVCGSAYKVLNSEEVIIKPETHEAIKISLLKKNSIGHPTVMMRNSIFVKHNIRYDESLKVAQDYDLWTRLIPLGKLHNLTDVLIQYRKHDNQVSNTNRKLKPKIRSEIRLKMLKHLNFNENDEECDLLRKIFIREEVLNYNEINKYYNIVRKLNEANKFEFYTQNSFNMYLKQQEQLIFKDYFLNRERFFPLLILHYKQAKSNSGFKLNFTDYYKFVVKSIIFYKKTTFNNNK